MITLTPPRSEAPFRQIKLHSGTTYFPDFSKGGQVSVSDNADIAELISEGWRMDEASAKSARFEANLLRKGAAAQMRRMPGVGDCVEAYREQNDGMLAEFNLRIGSEKVRVKRGDETITVAGVAVPLAELAPQVQRQLAIATARLDGSSFDLDSDLTTMHEARQAITAAIVSVMSDRSFRDRLVTAGTRRAK
jgi:hypothetical protein